MELFKVRRGHEIEREVECEAPDGTTQSCGICGKCGNDFLYGPMIRNRRQVREMNDAVRLQTDEGCGLVWSDSLKSLHVLDKKYILEEIATNPGYVDSEHLDYGANNRAGIVRMDRDVYVWEVLWYSLPARCDDGWEEADPYRESGIYADLKVYSFDDFIAEFQIA